MLQRRQQKLRSSQPETQKLFESKNFDVKNLSQMIQILSIERRPELLRRWM